MCTTIEPLIQIYDGIAKKAAQPTEANDEYIQTKGKKESIIFMLKTARPAEYLI